jgi:hypothetical protein
MQSAVRDAQTAPILEMLLPRDCDAFADGDWLAVEHDFCADRFEGIVSNQSLDPHDWTLKYPRLEDYRDDWLRGSKTFNAMRLQRTTPRELIHAMSRVEQLLISGDRAIAQKTFRADEPLVDGGAYRLWCQTLYRLHRIGGEWKIVGFVGYLPLKEAAQ